jgi:amino acid transporter
MMAPPAQARLLSYINGMATCLAFILATCGTLIYTGTFIVELGVVVSPSYTIELWHMYLCSVGVIIISILFNTYWIKAMPHMTSFSVVFINAATVFIFVTLLVKTHPKASASTVFLDVQNSTGWSSDGLVFLIALLPGGMVISMFDTAAHLAEELPHPERQVWQVMILTNIMNAVTTIAMCLALLFCLTQPENLLEPLGGMPILQLCWDAWPNKGFLVTVVICYLLMNVFATTSLLFAASRVIWSFSKTGAFPFSSWMSNVNSRLQVPSNSVIFTGVVVVSIGLLVLGPQTVQNGLFGAAGIFFTIAYLMPIILLLKKGRASIPASRSFNMGRVGPIVNIFACGWGVMLTVFLCFPMYIPISLSTMNWTSVCAVGFAFLALGNWFLVRKKYQLLHGLYVE